MYIEDEIIKIYFRYVSPAKILRNEISYKSFPRDEFENLMFCYLKEYSETESSLLYRHMKHLWVGESQKGENHLNVFFALEAVAGQLLVLRDNDIRCRYNELQRWRRMTGSIGEELPVCAFLARKSGQSGKKWTEFEWDTTLGHTNAALNKIMAEKISDNHFHLFGSAPVFHLIWIKLMNNVHTNPVIAGLRQIDRKRRNYYYSPGTDYSDNSLECMVFQAALIRALLYTYISGDKWLKIQYLGQKDSGGNAFRKEYSSKENFRPLQYLKEGERILDRQGEIRELINVLKSSAMTAYGTGIVDYANSSTEQDNANSFFAGERKLLYELLFKLFVEKSLPDFIANLLYAYLVIQSVLRAEIIQVNDNIGFENFSVYQGRKKYFLNGGDDRRHMIKYAVQNSFKPGNLQSLEIRISPENDYLEDARQIMYYDNILSGDGSLSKEQYYFVYHFPKRKDSFTNELSLASIPCRDAKMRKKARGWGNDIIRLRERMPKVAARIRGVDACSQEIGCRPEVFAVTFRRLQNHVTSLYGEKTVKQLKQTYHAGEDFLDVVDGLRALDEAVSYFNMRSGDRFGHATVLGINVSKWYEVKHNTIVIPVQDYLDNVVWLYQKLLEFQIDDCEQLKSYLRKQYEEFFYQIYAKYIEKDLKVSIHQYYESWMLRGDEPELYRTGVYRVERKYLLESWLINEEFPENQQIREKKEAAALYYHYHYNWNVREAGNVSREIIIPQNYIEGVEKVQKAMQKMIAWKGIGIETNPSSNLVISTMAGYEEHQIINLYNLGLKPGIESDCPQLCVSINTDDKGVFHTSLENEYALMASALENMKDANGEPVYTRQEIYDWINRIRVMGNRQVF